MIVQQMVEDRADQLAGLIEERLGIPGRGLETKLRRAGRALPRYIRREAAKIEQAIQLSANPKLMRQVDPTGIEKAFGKCESWLKTIDPKERRKDRILGFLAVNAFNFLVISGAFITWAVWTGRL